MAHRTWILENIEASNKKAKVNRETLRSLQAEIAANKKEVDTLNDMVV